ncbi:MAG TPA: response regulator [Blastocatellia bacterium]|nr:response regulator [Blastocatellia bacterium]
MLRIGLVVDDMFFVSKIAGAAERAGSRVERIKSLADIDLLATEPPELVIIDLNSDRLDPVQAIESLKSRPELSRVPVVGFVSHVQVDLIRRAQAAGCDHVIPRSKFTQLLGEIVSGNLASLR